MWNRNHIHYCPIHVPTTIDLHQRGSSKVSHFRQFVRVLVSHLRSESNLGHHEQYRWYRMHRYPCVNLSCEHNLFEQLRIIQQTGNKKPLWPASSRIVFAKNESMIIALYIVWERCKAWERRANATVNRIPSSCNTEKYREITWILTKWIDNFFRANIGSVVKSAFQYDLSNTFNELQETSLRILIYFSCISQVSVLNEFLPRLSSSLWIEKWEYCTIDAAFREIKIVSLHAQELDEKACVAMMISVLHDNSAAHGTNGDFIRQL